MCLFGNNDPLLKISLRGCCDKIHFGTMFFCITTQKKCSSTQRQQVNSQSVLS